MHAFYGTEYVFGYQGAVDMHKQKQKTLNILLFLYIGLYINYTQRGNCGSAGRPDCPV